MFGNAVHVTPSRRSYHFDVDLNPDPDQDCADGKCMAIEFVRHKTDPEFVKAAMEMGLVDDELKFEVMQTYIEAHKGHDGLIKAITDTIHDDEE